MSIGVQHLDHLYVVVYFAPVSGLEQSLSAIYQSSSHLPYGFLGVFFWRGVGGRRGWLDASSRPALCALDSSFFQASWFMEGTHRHLQFSGLFILLNFSLSLAWLFYLAMALSMTVAKTDATGSHVLSVSSSSTSIS